MFGNRLGWFSRSVIFFQYALGALFALTFVLSYLQEHSKTYLLIFAIITYSVSLLNSVLVCIKDPGMINKNQRLEIDYHEYQTIHDSRLFFEKYCVTCNIMRPATASHCGYCNVCVLGFDHHCFYFGTCIGIRNWRNFVLAVIFVTITSIYFSILNCWIFIQLAINNQSYQNYFNIHFETIKYIVGLSVTILIVTCIFMRA